MLTLALVIIVTVFLLLLAGREYVRWYFRWENNQRRGMNYYGRSLDQRRRFKRQIRAYSFFMPALVQLEKLHRMASGKHPPIPSVCFQGIYAPSYSCAEESLRRAFDYKPSSQDVFVVTQMKCGTTWMQQVVYETLCGGEGDLSDTGHNHLYNVSPWLESLDGVPVEDAPLVGSRQKRIIKTHLPASVCPYRDDAKYIYVARHPASCYASILDYFRLMAGSLTPAKADVLEWFCSSRMWFTPWAEHVEEWWKRRDQSNVLFCFFEDMKKDLGETIGQVAGFLNAALTEDQIRKVLCKCSFDYMKSHEEYFEMCPPNFCSVNGSYLREGGLRRYESVSQGDRMRIQDYCLGRLAGSSFTSYRI